MTSSSISKVESGSTIPTANQPRFRCEVCQQLFTRTDHLKRHQLRHSGVKPYICGFCNDAFSRCDSLRNHYSDCTQRGDRPIPETDQKGRRRHACELCISMKLRCEGESPCLSCQRRGVVCTRPSRTSSRGPDSSAPGSPVSVKHQDRPADLGSIKFLLNGGTESFTEDWSFPGQRQRTESTQSTQSTHSTQSTQSTQSQFSTSARTDSSSPAPRPLSTFIGHPFRPAVPEIVDISLVPDVTRMSQTWMSLMEGPFEAYHQQWHEPYASDLTYPSPHHGRGSDASDSSSASEYGPDALFASALVEALTLTLARMNLQPATYQELSSDLQTLLSPRRIYNFVHLYFKYWHQSCPLIHEPSFKPEFAQLPLLTAVVFMGAQYSTDQRELHVAKKLLDVAEMFIFQSDVFAPEAEIRRVLAGAQTPVDEKSDWVRFQHFQAGYLMVVIQYWAGNSSASNRAMETRFNEIIKVARAIELTKCRHALDDRIHQELWLQKETRVRTMCIIWSLDCAFMFFQNYPTRLSMAELDCDLPCKEQLYRSANPFTEPHFRFTRDLTLRNGFEALLNYGLPSTDSKQPAILPRDLDFTCMDMFLLIHVLYHFISSRMYTNSIPNLAGPTHQQSAQAPDDHIMADIQRALSCWREAWMVLRERTSNEEWETYGLYKNGFNFWMVAQLLVNKRDHIEKQMLMAPKMADKLARLKLLA